MEDKTLSHNNYNMKITAVLAGFILIVGGYSLRCYSECGKGEGNDQKNHIKCDSSTERYCSLGEVCGRANYTFYVSKQLGTHVQTNSSFFLSLINFCQCGYKAMKGISLVN